LFCLLQIGRAFTIENFHTVPGDSRLSILNPEYTQAIPDMVSEIFGRSKLRNARLRFGLLLCSGFFIARF
jgi:hypothetical protein